MSWFNRERAQSELDREAGKVHPDDLESVLQKQADIERKVHNSGKMNRFSGDIRLMFDMVRDYWRGNYREVPWKSIAAVAGALVYVLNPLDLIPDLIIGFGFIDDASVVAACLKLVETDLHRYAAWRAHRDERAS